MSFRQQYEASKDDARNRLVNEVMRIVLEVEKAAEASHERHDTQLHDIVEMRTEIGRLQAVVDSQSDMIKELQESMAKFREWAKTLKSKA